MCSKVSKHLQLPLCEFVAAPWRDGVCLLLEQPPDISTSPVVSPKWGGERNGVKKTEWNVLMEEKNDL